MWYAASVHAEIMQRPLEASYIQCVEIRPEVDGAVELAVDVYQGGEF